MDHLPLEIVDMLLEHMPLKEVITYSQLNKQFVAASSRQLRLRCKKINLSHFYELRSSTVENIFSIIGPHVRHIDANGDLGYKSWVFSAIVSCPQLESLTYTYRIHGVFGRKRLMSLKALSFVEVDCSECTLIPLLLKRSPNLESLTIDRTELTGKVLMAAPTNLRRLQFTHSELQINYLVDYLEVNQTIEELTLCVDTSDNTTDLTPILENLPQVRVLDLNCIKPITKGFELLANLQNLVNLKMQVKNIDFQKYPEALDASSQQLQEMVISIECINVTPEFADSFEKFSHLRKLTITFAFGVGNPDLLMAPLNRLGKNGKLQTLVLAGFTNHLFLDENRSQLNYIQELRVCMPLRCDCEDHFAMRPYIN